MTRLALLLPVLLMPFLAACSNATEATPAAWTLDSEDSRLSFVSVKAGTFAEVHHFKNLSGGIAEDGTATVEISLESVETLIDIRNERMREFLFETATFPLATVTAKIELAAFESMGVGDRQTVPLTATLDLHGASEMLEADVFVTRAAANRVTVETVDPIVIDAASFDLVGGLDKLQELAGLDSITPNVPVTFSLVFEG